MIELPDHPRILVITLRRLGDVLLTTPLVRTLREGLSGARIDALVFRGTEGMLAGNPDIAEIIAVPQRPTLRETLALRRRLWRRYDLAVATQSGDRPIIAALMAGRRRIGLVPSDGRGAWWKRLALHGAVSADPENHRLFELSRLAQCLGLSRIPDLVCPRGAASAPAVQGRYAVVHANPMYRYKRWTDAGWRELAEALRARGLAVVATGGPDAGERAYLDRVWEGQSPPVRRLDGKLGWPELADLLRGAAVFIGTDTSVTHLAAGSGCPTVALFGPTSPQLIGPWPVGGLREPWRPAGTIQHRGNVWVVQNPLPCLPCEKLGCAGHLDSHARCLDELGVAQVLRAVDAALAGRAAVPAST